MIDIRNVVQTQTQADALIEVRELSKKFTLHTQGGVQIPVLASVSFSVAPKQCLVLDGPSGAGKSTLMRCLYGNYLAGGGSIRVRAGKSDATGGGEDWVELTNASPQAILALRRHRMSYVSQFLRVIPRVSALDVVSEPMLALGASREEAHASAAWFLARLNVPGRLWGLPPATFSGGERQRVNIARGFVAPKPILLLDEPTASLDAKNREAVIELILAARERGAAMVGIFHDEDVRTAVGTHSLPVVPTVKEY